ncbi:MAG: VOC family protein [Planctomycetes bacterium]|nr:VOC family protein [Planctomycetota bacterium]
MFGTDAVVQAAIVVRDIEAKKKAWAEALGAPVPETVLTGPAEETNVRFEGGETEARAKLAFFRVGGISLELIEPVGRPSTWGKFLDERGEGLHHIAFNVKGTDAIAAAMAEKGVPVQQAGEYKGGRYTYLDTTELLGCIVELLEKTG